MTPLVATPQTATNRGRYFHESVLDLDVFANLVGGDAPHSKNARMTGIEPKHEFHIVEIQGLGIQTFEESN